jgi:hypothetical protein
MKKLGLAVGLCLVLMAPNAFAGNILVNPGFESGSLPPWFNSNDFCGGCTWEATTADAHAGSYSAWVSGNRLLEQDFAPTSTALISEVSLWLKMPDTGVAAIFFRYSDSSTEENIFSITSDWTQFNVTSYLDAGKSLAGFGVYGCSGCGGRSTTFADDFVVATGSVPDAGSSLFLLGLGLVGLRAWRRR